MADRDDRDTSLSGRSSGWAGQDRAPSAASSGRTNSGSHAAERGVDRSVSGYGASPGGGKAGYGWGNTAHSTERGIDKSLSGGGYGSPRDTGNVFGGGAAEHGRDLSLNSGVQGINDYVNRERRASNMASGLQGIEDFLRQEKSMTAASGPRGFGSALSRIGYQQQQLPNAFDLGMLGINPNIAPDRFGPAPTDMTGRVPTGYEGTRWAGGRFGPSVPDATGRTRYDKLKNAEDAMEPDPNPRNPRNRMTDREVLEMEQAPAYTDQGYYDYSLDRLRSYRR
jgi:hypothetical protein